jgi:predicted TIM-barrel enzyme
VNRSEFHDLFGDNGPIILPVIHVLDHDQTASNIDILIDAGVSGCFLINHDFDVDRFLPIIRSIRTRYPNFWIGVNFLAVTGRDAFPVLATLASQGYQIDSYWADDARIDEREGQQIEANEIQNIRQQTGWNGLYFGGTAFKKQRDVNPADYAKSAQIASGFMDVVTTSGIATGNAAKLSKVATFRSALPDTPIALASGITPENAADYAMVDCFMVATGINIADDFYNIDPAKLSSLILKCRKMGNPQ